MILGSLDAGFQAIQDLFVQLSRNPGKTCPLEMQPFIAALGGIKVLLICSEPLLPRKCSNSQGIRRIPQEAGPVFEWRHHAEGWDDLAELIDPVVKTRKACHQYLDRYAHEDAIVVLSRGEYGDQVFTGQPSHPPG